MSDISKINVDGVDYDVKDTIARDKLLNTAPKKLSLYGFSVSTTEKLTEALTKMFNEATSEGISIGYINISGTETPLYGGEWCVIVSNTWNAYGFALAFKYQTNTLPDMFACSCSNKTWGQWVKVSHLPTVSTSDNGKILKVVNGVWTAVAE